MTQVDFISEDPDINFLENKEETVRRLEAIGYTEEEVIGDQEYIVFVSATGNRIIVGQNSIGDAQYVGGEDAFDYSQAYDSEYNLQAALELAEAAKAVFGDELIHASGSSEEALARNIYAGQLAGVNIGNHDIPALDPEVKARMDEMWQKMNGPSEPAPELAMENIPRPEWERNPGGLSGPAPF